MIDFKRHVNDLKNIKKQQYDYIHIKGDGWYYVVSPDVFSNAVFVVFDDCVKGEFFFEINPFDYSPEDFKKINELNTLLVYNIKQNNIGLDAEILYNYILDKRKRLGTVKRLINYNHDNNYNILVPSDLNPFDFPPDVYKKLTANDVAYIIKTQPLYKSELETERYGNHVINGSYPPPLKIFRVKYIWADYYVLHLSQQP